MNTDTTRDARFWDRIAKRYSKRPVPDEAAYRARLERVRTYISGFENVLEIGCGTGTTALWHAPHVGTMVATDLSEKMIGIAQAKAQAQGVSNVRFATGTLHDPGLQLGSFDAVMAFNVLHLIQDVPAALRRVHELLKPGGLFISKTPCVGESAVLVQKGIRLLRAVGLAPFVNSITQATFRSDLRAAEFELVETDFYPQKSQNLFAVARAVLPLQ